jgi:hypothetical protein
MGLLYCTSQMVESSKVLLGRPTAPHAPCPIPQHNLHTPRIICASSAHERMSSSCCLLRAYCNKTVIHTHHQTALPAQVVLSNQRDHLRLCTAL